MSHRSEKDGMKNRFDGIFFDKESNEIYSHLKVKARELERDIYQKLRMDSRGRAAALTKLEECHMWLNKAIMEEQELRKAFAQRETEIVHIKRHDVETATIVAAVERKNG